MAWLALPLVALTASPGWCAPPGFNIAWTPMLGTIDNCPSQPINNTDEIDVCGATATSHYFVCSAVMPAGATAVSGEDVFIDMQVAAPVLDQYWHLETGGCRAGNLGVSADFTFPITFVQTTCKDYWAGQAGGGWNWASLYGGPNRARLEAVFAVQPSFAHAMTAGQEYYLLFARIKGGAQPASCAGCQDQAILTLTEADITQPVGVGDIVLTNASTRPFITWQVGATPARRATWGELKSLYR